jgi:2,3-dihydroxyphenylpropionate 1,2-dioxygenase
VDHGCAQTLEETTGSLTRYPVIPIIINSVAPPFAPIGASARWGRRWGAGGLDKRVLILGSGGLSHEPPVPLIAAAPDEIRQF